MVPMKRKFKLWGTVCPNTTEVQNHFLEKAYYGQKLPCFQVLGDEGTEKRRKYPRNERNIMRFARQCVPPFL